MRIAFTKIGDVRDQLITVGILIFALSLMVARQNDAFQNIRKASIAVASYMETPLSNVRVYRTALQTNTELERKNILLQDEISRLRSLQEENEYLRSLLEFRENSEYELHPVQIVSKNLTGINNNITIDAGTREGVKTGMPLVNSDGLIGTVIMPGSRYSQVLPLFNRNFRVSVQVESSRAYGIVSWNNDNRTQLVLNYVPRTISVEPGMRVHTSGLSNQMPPNIPVGEVLYTEPEPGKETQVIYLRPYVSMFTVAEGHVLLYEADEEILELDENWQATFQ